jgi:hypothetical protein
MQSADRCDAEAEKRSSNRVGNDVESVGLLSRDLPATLRAAAVRHARTAVPCGPASIRIQRQLAALKGTTARRFLAPTHEWPLIITEHNALLVVRDWPTGDLQAGSPLPPAGPT